LVWIGDTAPASVETAISKTVASGYDILEFSLHDSINLDRRKTRELLSTNSIQVACSRGLARDADISSDDAAVVARGAALLHESLEVTHDIGGSILTGALYSKATRPLTATGRDNVVEEDDFVSPVREVGDRLGYGHIGENHRGYLGSGHIDFPAFFEALAEIDYRGPVTFESFLSAFVAPGLSNDLAIWRNLWDDGADLAAHARRYIHQGLRDARAREAAHS
jgi:D-psicose/D-tagatose/L-ribulose 3-epimerase